MCACVQVSCIRHIPKVLSTGGGSGREASPLNTAASPQKYLVNCIFKSVGHPEYNIRLLDLFIELFVVQH